MSDRALLTEILERLTEIRDLLGGVAGEEDEPAQAPTCPCARRGAPVSNCPLCGGSGR